MPLDEDLFVRATDQAVDVVTNAISTVVTRGVRFFVKPTLVKFSNIHWGIIAGISAAFLGVTGYVFLWAGLGATIKGMLWAATITGLASGIATTFAVSYLRFDGSKLGLVPPDIKVERYPDEVEKIGDTKTHKVHFELSNIKIIDYSAIKRAVDAAAADTSKPTYDFDKLPSHRVRAIIKNSSEVTLAELEYADWKDNPNVEIKVFDNDGNEVAEGTRDEVLTTLEMLPIFLGDNANDPESTVDQCMVSSGSGRRVGGIFGRLYGGLSRALRGEPIPSYTVNPARYTGKLEAPDFLSRLVFAATKLGKYEDILGHYQKKVVDGRKAALIISKNIKLREKEQAAKDVSPLAFFVSPLISLVLIGIVVAVAPGFFAFIIAAALSVGVSALSGYYVHKIRISKIKGDIDQLDSELLSLEDEKTQPFRELVEVSRKLQRFLENPPRDGEVVELSLAKVNLDDASMILINHWLVNDSVGRRCTKLSGIDSSDVSPEMIKLLFSVLNESNVNDISLGEVDGEIMREALENNIAITNVEYSYDRVSDRVVEELAVNRYLHGIKKRDGYSLVTMEGKPYLRIDNSTNLVDIDSKVGAKIRKASVTQMLKIDTSGSEIPQVVKNEVRQRKLGLISSNELGDTRTLVIYIETFHEMSDDDFVQVNQEKVLKLIKTCLFDISRGRVYGKYINLRSNDNNPGLAALRGLDGQVRRDLLERCFTKDYEVDIVHIRDEAEKRGQIRGIAAIVSELINNPDLFDPKKTGKVVDKLRECLKSLAKGEKWTYKKYMSELQSLQDSLDAPDPKLQKVIQAGYQGYLEGQFPLLLPPFHYTQNQLETFRKKLKTHEELISFDFHNDLPPEVRKVIEDIIERNKVVQEVGTLISEIKHEKDLISPLALDRDEALLEGDEKKAAEIESALQRITGKKLAKLTGDNFTLENVKKVLEGNFELRKFKLAEGANEEAKQYVETVMERNLNCDEIHWRALSEDIEKRQEALDMLIQACNNDAEFTAYYFKYLESCCEKPAEFLQDMVMGDVKKLQEFKFDADNSSLVGILRGCFADEKDKNFKAGLIACVIRAAGDDKDLWKIVEVALVGEEDKVCDSKKLQQYLEEERYNALKSKDITKADLIEKAFQDGLNTALLLSSGTSVDEYHKQLKENYYLRRVSAGKETEPLVTMVCKRNQINGYIEMYKDGIELDEDGIKKFIELIAGLTDNEQEFIFDESGLDRNDLLHVIRPFVGKHGVVGVGSKIVSLVDYVHKQDYGAQVEEFDWKVLKGFNQKNRDTMGKFFKIAFAGSEEKPDAAKKANMICDLLEKFDYVGHGNDPVYKRVIEAVYWAVVPAGSENKPYYRLKDLSAKLDSIKTKYQTSAERVVKGLTDVLGEVVEDAKKSTPVSSVR